MTEDNETRPLITDDHNNIDIIANGSTLFNNNSTDSGIVAPSSSSSFAIFENDVPGTGLSETTALRLYTSLHRTSTDRLATSSNTNNITTVANLPTANVSWLSLTDQSDTCRICRYKRNDTELIQCPCRCSGTMGFIHIKCLRRWMRLRSDNHCEICKESFNFPQDTKNYFRLFTSFFQPQYFGACIKIVLNLITLTPLAYFTMNQLINTMDTFHDDQPVKILVIGPTMLLATSIYFLFYFEWALSCFIRLKNILKHWWNFGDQDDEDYGLISDPESDIGIFDFDF